MNIRRAALGFVALTLAMVLVDLAVAGDARKVWRHSKGTFVNVEGAKWEERGINDEVRYRFDELSRSDQYVRLFDKTRDVIVLLAKDACYYNEKGSGEKKTKLYNGSWQK